MKRFVCIILFLFVLSFLDLITTSVIAQTEIKLVLGNPSAAAVDLIKADNYLVVHSGFILSYNKERGGANWVTWHLSKTDIADAERTNAFTPDTSLPRDWWIKPTDLVLKGYDRGHLCPSEERTDSEQSNRETFLMSNMVPQTARLNRGAWKSLETYIQKTVPKTDSEAYIIAGCYGDKGRIKDRTTIPTSYYKIAVVMPEGDNDLRRITKEMRVIAADMPNESTNKSGWKNYITTVGSSHLNVAFQCKRWTKETIGRPHINQFRDDIQGQYELGLFFTTANFSSDAESNSAKPGAVPIALFNGNAIVDIMLEKQLGVERDSLDIYNFNLELAIAENNEAYLNSANAKDKSA